MAGAGYKLFNTGDVLTAAQVNTYLMEQTVMVFANAAARTTALSGVVSEGMISYLKDTNAVEVYDGSNWVSSDDPNAIQNTIVDAKGDLIAASAADTPARLAVGNNGETLVADSSTSTGLRYVPPMANLANPFINGGFDIWQRGTSIAMTSVLQYACDRWISGRGGWTTGSTVSRQSTNDTTNLPTIRYCMRVQRDSGNTNTQTIFTNTSVETSNAIPYAGRSVTLTFWARAGANFSSSGSGLAATFYTGTGTDQTVNAPFTGSAAISGVTHTLTTTWQRFAQTFTIGATATEFAVEFAYTPTGTAGANDFYELTGVQLDVGTFTASSAPAFRRAGGTLAGELAACQRYYWRVTNNEANFPNIGSGYAESTTAVIIAVSNPVPMRVKPTSFDASGLVGSDGVTTLTPSLIELNAPGFTQSRMKLTVTGATQYRPYIGFLNGNNTYFGLNAEL